MFTLTDSLYDYKASPVLTEDKRNWNDLKKSNLHICKNE